jgi:hypothetical protein
MLRSVRYRSCADALILLLSCVLLQSAWEVRASASCGDWLAHPSTSHSPADRTASDLQLLVDADGPAGRSLASSDQPSKLPCDGPFCRNVPTKPVPTAPSSTVNLSDRLLLAAHGFVCEPLSRWMFTTGDTSAHALRGYPVYIEHPPRA